MSPAVNSVFIGIGSNLSDPRAQVRSAFAAIEGDPDLELLSRSSLYSNPPMGPIRQADYINAVEAVSTSIDNHALLERLQGIELTHGRARTVEKWGPRTLDLDILLRGDVSIDTDALTIPHPGLLLRAFVIVPLAQIAPNLILPNGITAAEMAGRLASDRLVCLSDE